MKKTLLTIAVLLLIAAFAFSLTACDKEVKTLQNDFGAVVEGGGFKEGSLLITNEIKADSAEAEEVLSAIADKSYDKEGDVYIYEIHVTSNGVKVQPNGRVKITIPNPGITSSNCVVFHIKSDNSVEEITPTVSERTITFEASSFSRFIIARRATCVHDWDEFRMIERPTCNSKGILERTCKLCGITEQRETPDFAAHNYGEFVLVEENDCLRTGKAVRTCNICGDEDIAFLLGDHKPGALVEAKEPTFFVDGCIEHFVCNACGKYLDKDLNVIDNAIIPKLSANLSICLNGEIVAPLKVKSVSETTRKAELVSDPISVKKGDVVTICQTDNPSVQYEFVVTFDSNSVSSPLPVDVCGNLNADGSVRTTSSSAVYLTIEDAIDIDNLVSYIKFELSMDGYRPESGVVAVVEHYHYDRPLMIPMEKVNYPGDPDKQVYVFGLFEAGESYCISSISILDIDSGKTYGFADIDPRWDTWSFSCGTSGEIEFNGNKTDWWLAFDIGGNKKIELHKLTKPAAGTSTDMVFTNGDKFSLDKVTLDKDDDKYLYYTFPVLDTHLGNRSEYSKYVSGTTLDIERIEIYADAGAKFYLSNTRDSSMAHENLAWIDAPAGAITADTRNGYIVINAAGKYIIDYVPYSMSIFIYYVEETPTPDPDPHEHVYIDGKCECGEIDPDYAPSHKHEYVDSKCECGAVDSNYKGIVFEKNGDRYAMNFVTYPTDGVNSYVYGYVYINAGDKLLIRDTESGAVWGYDDIDERFGWNTWDYHRGDNGEIVFDFTARYAFEFDYDGCKKLYITKVFDPKHGESFGTDFDGEREDVIFDSFDLSASAGAEGEFMWTLTHATTMNSSDFTEYINKNGLWFYYAIIDLEEGESFSLKNLTTGGTIGADHISEITGDITAITRDGDLVSVKKSGRFNIMYLPAFNSFTIECDTTDPLSEINLYAGDKALTLIPDENGDIFYEGFESTTYHIISIDDARYSPLPIILDESMDKTLVDLTVSGDYYTAYPNKEGIYNLRYNVYTGILYLEYVDSGEEEVSIPYQIYISYDNKLTLKENSENPDELCYLGLTLGAWDDFSVRDTELNYITDMTITEGSDVVTNGRTITVQVGGTFDFYINKTTHEVRMVVSEGGGAGGDVDYSDGLYLYLDGGFITIYPNADGDVKYLGIAATDETSVAFLDKSYNYLPMTLDPASDSSIAKVSSANMLFFYKTGTANIIYNVNTGIISVEMTDISLAGAKVYMYLSGTTTTLTANESGIVSYEGLVIESSSSILLTGSAFEYLPMILDPAMDTSLGSLYESDDVTMLIINGAGTYNLYYNLTTNVVLLEAVPET